MLKEIGRITLFFITVMRTGFATSGNTPAIISQIAFVSYRTLSTVLFAGVFVGAILIIQFGLMLQKYDAIGFMGGLSTSATIREIGPLIISFLLAGKIGAFTAAELGTMRVTEQIDAIECLGTNSIQYLIVPRFVGIVISSVLLVGIGLFVSIFGSMLVARGLYGVNSLQYLGSVAQFNDFGTLATGFFKTAVYSTIVATVACYYGYFASGGARGVGRAVTLSAIYTNFYIVMAQYITGGLIGFLRNLTGAMDGVF